MLVTSSSSATRHITPSSITVFESSSSALATRRLTISPGWGTITPSALAIRR